jgi:hypothetical protein
MKLYFANLAHLLIERFMGEGVLTGASACEILKVVEPENPAFDNRYSPSGYSDIYNKGRDFSHEVKQYFLSLDYNERKRRIENAVFSRIPGNKAYVLKEFLLNWIKDDVEICSTDIVFKDLNRTKTDVIDTNDISPLDYLTETFCFVVSRANQKPSFDAEETDRIIHSIERPGSLTHNTVFPNLATVKDVTFDNVFKEIRLSPIDGIYSPNDFRVYHLAIQNQLFLMDHLENLLKKNIGHYVFTRTRINRYENQNDIESVNLDAISNIRKIPSYSGTDVANILLYIFLEHVLKAPKIMSGYELQKNGQNDFTGIHLLNRKTEQGEDYFQLVFGSSCLSGGLTQAIDDGINKLGQLKRNPYLGVRVIDDIDLDSKFSPDQVELLKKFWFHLSPEVLFQTLDTAFFSDISLPRKFLSQRLKRIFLNSSTS